MSIPSGSSLVCREAKMWSLCELLRESSPALPHCMCRISKWRVMIPKSIMERILTSSGTFLTATPSGNLTATAPSRGPLEAFRPIYNSTANSSFPSFALQTQSDKYLSVSTTPGLVAPGGSKSKWELRADSDEVNENERVRIKCQREFVLKAKLAKEGEGSGNVAKRRFEGGAAGGSLDDEMSRK